MKKYYIIISFLFVACTSNNTRHCVITVKEILAKDLNKVFIIDSVNGNILRLRDKGDDSITGGDYSFYENGGLKSYKFFANLKTYTYNEEYDVNGNLTKVENIPLYSVVKDVNPDSLNCSFHFFSVNKLYQKVNLLINNKSVNLDLQDDTLYSNMKVASLGLKLKGIDSIKIYLNVLCKNICINKTQVIKDTINLSRKINR